MHAPPCDCTGCGEPAKEVSDRAWPHRQLGGEVMCAHLCSTAGAPGKPIPYCRTSPQASQQSYGDTGAGISCRNLSIGRKIRP